MQALVGTCEDSDWSKRIRGVYYIVDEVPEELLAGTPQDPGSQIVSPALANK